MNTPNIQGALGAQQKTAPGQSPSPTEPAGGASFQALLEKLEGQATGLGRKASQGLDTPSDLGGAVADARNSLDAALGLGRDLLEAYRQAHLDKAG
jgi:hypothetical protein